MRLIKECFGSKIVAGWLAGWLLRKRHDDMNPNQEQ